jgi:exonuclease III
MSSVVGQRDGRVTALRGRNLQRAVGGLAILVTTVFPAGATDACRLRIVCFNAEQFAVPGEQPRLPRFRFEPARRRHVERLAAVIEVLDPDILVMSEVLSREGVETLAAVVREKGVDGFRGYHVDGADGFSGFDVAVFSRFEPDEVEGRRIAIHLPARRGGRARSDGPADAAATDWLRQPYSFVDDRGQARNEEAVLQRHAVAYFTICGRRLGILGLHLKSNPSDPGSNAQRTAETRIACELIRREIVARGYTPVVLGDLNDYDPDVPMADERRKTATTVLRDLKDYDGQTAGPELVNVAGRMPRLVDRYTSHWDVNENGAADPQDVFTMIDHILVHRELEPAITRAFICHAVDLDVSDHFPVVVDLDLARLPR